MTVKMVVLLAPLIVALAWLSPAVASDRSAPLSELLKPGRILMLRHANAPGFGDPPHFVVADCSTQRNLDASGRVQAKRIGSRLRAEGVVAARILSSQWCRALETARLLDLGPVEPLAALNSFYDHPRARTTILTALRKFLAELPIDGGPVILVSHQVVINAFTDALPASGGGSLFQLNGTGSPQWIGAIMATE